MDRALTQSAGRFQTSKTLQSIAKAERQERARLLQSIAQKVAPAACRMTAVLHRIVYFY